MNILICSTTKMVSGHVTVNSVVHTTTCKADAWFVYAICLHPCHVVKDDMIIRCLQFAFFPCPFMFPLKMLSHIHCWKRTIFFLDKGNKTLFYHYMALIWHYLCHQRFRLLCFWFHFYNSPHELANFLYPDHLNLVEYNFRIWYITKVLGVSESLVSLSLFEWLTV